MAIFPFKKNISIFYIYTHEFKPNNDDFYKVHFHILNLGNKQSSNSLVECCAIHVDCGPNWKHEACYMNINTQLFLKTLDSHWKSGRALRKGGGGGGGGGGRVGWRERGREIKRRAEERRKEGDRWEEGGR